MTELEIELIGALQQLDCCIVAAAGSFSGQLNPAAARVLREIIHAAIAKSEGRSNAES